MFDHLTFNVLFFGVLGYSVIACSYFSNRHYWAAATYVLMALANLTFLLANRQ